MTIMDGPGGKPLADAVRRLARREGHDVSDDELVNVWLGGDGEYLGDETYESWGYISLRCGTFSKRYGESYWEASGEALKEFWGDIVTSDAANTLGV